MGRALEYNLTTLRVSRAYVSLLSRPEGDAAAVSLAWIGDFEIRMHAAPPTSAVKQPLFIIDIAEGAAAFDEVLSLAEPVTGGTHEKPPSDRWR